jgi:dienelactone hydrolase
MNKIYRGKSNMTSLEFIQNLISSISPSMAYTGENIEEWQKEAHGKLEELLGLPLAMCEDMFRILEEKDGEKYKTITFEFQSEPGYFVEATMLVPNQLTKPLSGVICLQGHSTGAHISLGIPKFPGDEEDIAGGRDFAVRAVEEGFCAIALDQRYMGAKGQNENGDPACSRKLASMSSLLIGRTPIGERVWDVHRLIDVIEKYLADYIDAKKIICMGNSGGGTATFYASCYDKRISVSIPSCAVCTFDDSIVAMKHCPCNYVPNIRKYFDMGDLGCLIAPRPLVVVCGVEDKIFPLHGVEKTFAIIKKGYQDAKADKLCHLVKGNGGHQFYPDDAWPIAKKMMNI